tara:strand:- start:1684 stop:2217 length:534 start_codon:yes stop_codon:yes gene_type:complete
MNQTLKQLTPLLVVFTVLLSSSFINAAWLAPLGTPLPTNNAPAPINLSATNQIKLGDITALNLKAGGQVWASEYCDENGQNCFDTGSTRGNSMVSNWPDFIKCDGASYSDYLVSHNSTDNNGRHLYKIDSVGSHITIVFNSDGSYYTGANFLGWDDCQRSIDQFYADGDAYSLVGGQ